MTTDHNSRMKPTTHPPHDPLLNDPLMPRVLEAANAIGGFIEWWGFKANLGRIWTYLALRNTPTSQADLARVLGVSRSLMSSALADLSKYQLVSPTSDHRNAPYEAKMDIWSAIAHVLRTREWMMIESVRVAMEAAVLEAERLEEDDLTTAFDLDRVQMLLKMTELAQSLLRVIIALRLPSKGLPKLGVVLKQIQDLTRKLRQR